MRFRHISVLFAALALAGAGCMPSSPVGTDDQKSFAFGSTVTLGVGESATYTDGLSVTLKQVDDSRCPADVVCIWAGELAPLLTLSGGSIGVTAQEARLGTTTATHVSIQGYDINLKGATERSATIMIAKGSAPAGGAQSSYKDLLRKVSVSKDMLVKSPLGVTGEARGTWYFEASFPVKLLDGNGKVLFQGPAQAIGDWMTEEFVPFSINIPFETPATATGSLVLEKDNPSGLPEHDDKLVIPVRFK